MANKNILYNETFEKSAEVPSIVNTTPSTLTSSHDSTDKNQASSVHMHNIQNTPSTSYGLRKKNDGSTLDSNTRESSYNIQSDDESDIDFTRETDDSDSSDSECTSTCSDSDNSDSENTDFHDDNSNTQTESNENDWQDITDDVPVFSEYVGDSTTNVPPTAKTPTDYYELFVTEEIINKMVEETNNYARKYQSENQTKSISRVKAWIPTDKEEIKRFLGVLMVMGLLKVPHFNDYWSKKGIYRNEYIISIMKRDRFYYF